MYLGIYFWNNGSPQLRLYKRSAGNWIQLGGSYASGPLAAGTVLKLASVGSRIAFSAGRGRTDRCLRRQHQRGAARDHDVRRCDRRQLVRRSSQRSEQPRCTRSAGSCPVSRERLCCRTTAATTLLSAGTGRFSSRRSFRAGRRTPSRSRRLRRARVVLSPTAPAPSVQQMSRVSSLCARRLGRRAAPTISTEPTEVSAAPGPRSAMGALTISSNAVVGSSAVAGDVRVAETYGADQFSSVEVTSTQLTGRAVGRTGRASAEQRSRHVSRDLLLEQRQPPASALQAERRQLDPARRLVRLRPLGGRHRAQAGERRLASRVFARTGSNGSLSPTAASARGSPGS